MRRDIIIKTSKEEEFSVEDLYDLRHAAFQQWTDANLYTSALHTTITQFQRYLADKTVFVAQDVATNELLAMVSLSLNQKKCCAVETNVSVAPKVKRQGIGTLLLEAEVQWLLKAGYRYLTCSTAIPATWSVQWHLKNGYHIVGYSRNEKVNYASYIFRKQIAVDMKRHPTDILWTRPIAPLTAKIQYVVSYFVTCICKTRTGRLNWLGKLASSVLEAYSK